MGMSSSFDDTQEYLIRELRLSRQKTEIMETTFSDLTEELLFIRKQTEKLNDEEKQILSTALDDLIEELKFTRWQLESLHSTLDDAFGRVFHQDTGHELKEMLVRMMYLALQHWEEATGTTKLELAEKSGIWKVHLDKGYFRVRTLDRYLSVPSLPQHPRWKDVTRTVRFVLAQGESSISQQLRQTLKNFQHLLIQSSG